MVPAVSNWSILSSWTVSPEGGIRPKIQWKTTHNIHTNVAVSCMHIDIMHSGGGCISTAAFKRMQMSSLEATILHTATLRPEREKPETKYDDVKWKLKLNAADVCWCLLMLKIEISTLFSVLSLTSSSVVISCHGASPVHLLPKRDIVTPHQVLRVPRCDAVLTGLLTLYRCDYFWFY